MSDRHSLSKLRNILVSDILAVDMEHVMGIILIPVIKSCNFCKIEFNRHLWTAALQTLEFTLQYSFILKKECLACASIQIPQVSYILAKLVQLVCYTLPFPLRPNFYTFESIKLLAGR